MRIVFMGTPDFAVPSLAVLLENGYEIAGVVTAPDKPGGRKGIQESAVKKYALEHGLKILQPARLKSPEFIEELRSLGADLQVVVAFRMLPEIVWQMPRLGTLNLHGSLLPKYRGAAPINWAIINGETETGVTTFFLQHEIDTGNILYQEKISIDPDETAGELHDRMMVLGAGVVLKTVNAIRDNQVNPQPQEDTDATHAPKIFTSDCEVNFNQPTREVHNFIRGLSPWPGAWTTLPDGRVLKITKTRAGPVPNIPAQSQLGHIFSDGKTWIAAVTADGALFLEELQLEGKRRMEPRELLNGNKGLFAS